MIASQVMCNAQMEDDKYTIESIDLHRILPGKAIIILTMTKLTSICTTLNQFALFLIRLGMTPNMLPTYDTIQPHLTLQFICT